MQYSAEDIRSFGNLELLARQLVEGFITGLHKSPYHGFSVEFAEHRLYNTGESTRFIDWRVFSRTDKLYIKQFEEETNLRCHILLDISSSMYYPKPGFGKLTFSILAASAITILLEKQRDAVGLVTFDKNPEFIAPPKANKRHIHEVLLQLQRLLDRSPENLGTNLPKALHELGRKAKKRSLVVIFSDFFQPDISLDELKQALNHLVFQNNEVIIFDVVSGDLEEELLFKDQVTEFQDLETGEKVKVNPHVVRKEYVKQLKGFKSRLKEVSGNLNIDLYQAKIEEGFNPILSNFLIKRSKMS